MRFSFQYLKVLSKPVIVLLLVVEVSNTCGDNIFMPGDVTTIKISINSGDYCFWELYSRNVSDFLSTHGNCENSQAEILKGQGTPEIMVHWKKPGTFFHKVTVIDPYGCTNISVGKIIVDPLWDREFFIPEGFSPGSDGIHDEFRIQGIEKYPEACLTIYNRKGQIIFKKEKYGNIGYWGISEDAWWHGNVKGAGLVAQGNYLFVLVLNELITIRGTVMVAYDDS